MSSNGETSVVLRGVTHGAVDFLIKPVRVEELRNVWQHVVRKKKDKVKRFSAVHECFSYSTSCIAMAFLKYLVSRCMIARLEGFCADRRSYSHRKRVMKREQTMANRETKKRKEVRPLTADNTCKKLGWQLNF